MRRIAYSLGLIVGLLALGGGGWLFATQASYTLATVTLGGGLLGALSGFMGVFAVLRRQSLIGDALSHSALPGIGIAFLLFGRDLPFLLIGAGLASALSALFISLVKRTTRLKQDSIMGIALTAFFALGLVLLTYIQGRGYADQAGLDSFIFGQAAALARRDLWLLGGLGLVLVATVGLFWKEFKLLTFDPVFARTNGYPVTFLDSLLTLLLVLTIILGLPLAGVILIVGLLIAPPVAARQWTHSLGALCLLAALFGATAGASGALISASTTDMPTGPWMIVMASLWVFVSLLFAPQRGLWWRWRRALRLSAPVKG
jgi:manganese/zinc/iron transport system permease protein